jgi:amino acid transporter
MLAADKHWSGIGYALVFCILSFAGFEGAATLGQQTHNPHRSIPIASLGTCVLAGAFYVFATFAQVMGFGVDSTDKLADPSAPLNDLATRYVSTNFASTIDLAAAISAFSCVLGSLSAAARLLFAMDRAGLGPKIADVHSVHGTPAAAVILTSLLCIGGLVADMELSNQKHLAPAARVLKQMAKTRPASFPRRDPTLSSDQGR